MSIEFYNKNAVNFINGTVSADMSETWDKFLIYVSPGGRILDAGCGSGRDTLFFKYKGYDVLAFDASEEMVRLSSALTGQQTLMMRFEDLEFRNEFDGVWACASLLHVSKADISRVLDRIAASMRVGGVFFASFKYGEGEVERNARVFNCYDENSLRELLLSVSGLETVDVWVTSDVRPGRENERWVNCLCRKVG
jgi:2-polyprenyl-3-methyl-5-hydroxy-6-metoxy-1,4-benzoquinol methylase